MEAANKVHIQGFRRGWLMGMGHQPGLLPGPHTPSVPAPRIELGGRHHLVRASRPEPGHRAAALDAGEAGSVFNLRGLVPVVNPRTTFRVGSFI